MPSSTTSMKINDLQRVLLNTYADGEYAGIQRSEDLRTALTGDMLFAFLFNELDDDCYKEAEGKPVSAAHLGRYRLLKAIVQISEVTASL